MDLSGLPPIPWVHAAEEFGSLWIWETPLFVVTVNGNQRSCYFTIADKSGIEPGAQPRILSDGQAASFEQAERMIRATVGKAYHPSLGYQHYAGPLATTFRLADAQDKDLGPYAGHEVEVIVLNRDGTESTYTGNASIQHYELVLVSGSVSVRITPSFIRSIRFLRSGGSHTGPRPLNRTVRGQVSPGCTGVAGFIAGTVEHRALSCPIHEDRPS